MHHPPHPLLVRAIRDRAPGRALDLACGRGRNALLLASRGWQVTAVDTDRVAIESLDAAAREQSLSIEPVLADLEKGEFVLPPDSYDLICDMLYLQRNLFAPIRAAVRQGGRFVASILVENDPLREPRRFRLRPGELEALFSGWKIDHYAEGDIGEGDHRHDVAEIIALRI